MIVARIVGATPRGCPGEVGTGAYPYKIHRPTGFLMTRLSLLTVLIKLLLVAEVFATDPTIIEAAKKEGSLVFYTTMDIQNSKPLLDAFTKKYPFVKGDLVRLGGTAMVSRILTEAQANANRFDVAVGISPSYIPTPIRTCARSRNCTMTPWELDDNYEL